MSPRVSLSKFVAPEFIFGPGARHLVAQYARNLGARKVLVVSDPGVVEAGWAGEAHRCLEAAGIPAVMFTGVTSNPRADEVARGADEYRTAGCDVIVAVGGGSPMDCAKGIGIVTANSRPILEFEGVDQILAPMPPLICIPTTGGTSADVSQFAIITDMARRVKISIVSKAVIPDVSLVDPETLGTMPPYLAACTAIDALVHAIEALVSTAGSPLTDVHALEAIRTLLPAIERFVANRTDPTLQAAVMRASLEAGLAFSNASLGAVHAMAHSLGGFLDLPHGECNCLLLPHVIAFNWSDASDRLGVAAQAMGLDQRGMSSEDRRKALVQLVFELRDAAGIAGGLGARGVRVVDVPQLAVNAMHDVCIVTNPRRPNTRDIETVYEEAL